MTPQFALSLSFDGIRLLHRGPEGWSSLGEVPLDSPDLADALAELRGQAEGAADWTGTLLLLPSEQVRFLTLDDPEADAGGVRAALDGATPYALDELVIDYTSDGRATYIAAVARETLEEAETFAAEHGFRPLAFAALRPDGPEAFFGPTRLAATLQPETGAAASGSAVEDAGASNTSMPEVTAAVEEASGTATPPLVEPPADEAVLLAPIPDLPPLVEEPSVAIGKVEAPALLSNLTALTEAANPETQSLAGEGPTTSLGLGDVAASVDIIPVQPVTAEASTPRHEPIASAEPKAAEPIPASLEAVDPLEPVESVTPLEAAAQETGESAARAPLAANGVPQAIFVPRARPLREPENGMSAGRAEPRLASVPPLIPTPPASARQATLAAPPRVEREKMRVPPKLAAPGMRREPVITTTARPEPAAPSRPETVVAVAPSPAEPPLRVEPRAQVQTPAQAAASAPLRSAPASRTAAPAAQAQRSGRPRYLALILTAILLLVMATVAVLASASDRGLAGLLRREAAPATGEIALNSTAQQEATSQVVSPGDRRPATPSGVAITLDEAERVYAATGVWLRAPRLPVTPRVEDLTEPTLALALDKAPVVALPILAPAGPDRPPFAATPLVVKPDERGSTLGDAEAFILAAGAPELTSARRPVARPGAPDVAPVAAAEAGRPSVSPRARPASPEQLAAEARPEAAPPAGGVGLAGLRPAPRPDEMASEPAPEALAAFDGPSPAPRPEGLAPEPPAAPDVSDAVAAALAESPAPDARPAPEAQPAAPTAPDLQSTLAAIVQNAPPMPEPPVTQAAPRAAEPAPAPRQQPQRQQPSSGGVGVSDLAPNEQAEAGEAEPASSAAALASGPTAATVAQVATHADAMALRDINLIGVFGQPNDRRALVRMPNGRYLRVGVGDGLDGGQVTAIGDNALNYVKRGRTLVLAIPGG